jgi:hypothetical protein
MPFDRLIGLLRGFAPQIEWLVQKYYRTYIPSLSVTGSDDYFLRMVNFTFGW